MRVIQRYGVLFLNENIRCDPSVELSGCNVKNYPKLSVLPLIICSTECIYMQFDSSLYRSVKIDELDGENRTTYGDCWYIQAGMCINCFNL